jgi:serine/threonine-protein kinase HipA
MSGTKPVWVWLPNAHEPVRCGSFTLAGGVGTFEYDDAYRSLGGAVALDPLHLPLTRSHRPVKETRQGGLFGVIRDASPEGFGLALLERLKETSLTDPLMRLEMAQGDGVGAIEVCEDIAAKMAHEPPSSQDLFDALVRLAPERPSSQAARSVKGVHGTSLGGERPKLTVMHKGQQWIAKLQDRGDPPHAPLREFAAMQVAGELGLDVAQTEFHRVGEREVILVRRFDRHVTDAGKVQRSLYASAHTVLRLDHEVRGERARSYVALARELQRFCADSEVDPVPLQRELWKRMVYNAVCGNGDDHPRNHGFVHDGGHWRLSPAFDIAPYITYSGVQAMAVTRSGGAAATRANLLQDCAGFGWAKEEGAAFLEHARATLLQAWPRVVRECGFGQDELPARDPAQWLE